MLNLCYEFSLSNNIIFNPIKYQCMVFKPNRFKLYCPAVYLNGNIIDYVEKTKYLEYMFTNDKQDDVEMLRQLRLLYMRSNKIIRMFYFCTIDVKLELFRPFCTSFYCCYLWTGYKKSTFNRLRVAFNNAYQRILDLPWRCSASGMNATYGIYNLEAIIRKQHLDLSVDYVKVVTQLYKPLKMHGLLEYSYGILGLKCCILIDDTFDGNMLL